MTSFYTVYPLVLAFFGKLDNDGSYDVNYPAVFWTYFWNNLELMLIHGLATMAFVKVEWLVRVSEKVVKNTLLSILIVILNVTLSALMMSIDAIDTFIVPLWVIRIIIAIFAISTALIYSQMMIYMPPLAAVPRT